VSTRKPLTAGLLQDRENGRHFISDSILYLHKLRKQFMKLNIFQSQSGGKMMKRYGLILTMSLFLLLSVVYPSFAAKDGNIPMKIGVVDLQKVMQTAKAAKDAQAAFDKELQAARETLSTKAKEVQVMEEELKKRSPKLSTKKRKEKEEQLAKASKDLKRLESDMGEEFRRKVGEINQRIIGEIREVVNEIRQEEQCTLILEKNTLISYDQAIDVTDKVIQRYDAKKK